MAGVERSVVTGAFSYTGSHIARRLLDAGDTVLTLSRRPDPCHPLAASIAFAPLRFDRPAALTAALRGADALYNTYWVRFPHGATTYERAVENTRVMLRCAREAGVRRVVHLSVTHPSVDSPLPYFRHKAVLEREVRASGLDPAIVRPTLIFGAGDILVNNIAWALRRFPLFLVPGRGDYRVQPVGADDVAALAVEAGRGAGEVVVDAAGPDVHSFDELVGLVASAVGARARVLHAPPGVALVLSRAVGWTRRDVMLTREELDGLMASLLVSPSPPLGRERFVDWLEQRGDRLGSTYVSELGRNFRGAP